MLNRIQRAIEPLEARLCLTVVASVDDGDLLVEGDADGVVEIIAQGNGTFHTDVLQGIDDDIRIRLEDDNAGTDDTVIVNLNGEAVDRVFADLGDGNNTLELTGGTASSVVYRGGDGADDVSVSTSVESWMFARLGDGENSLDVAGQVGRLIVRGGHDADFVTIADTATVDRGVSAYLGDGENSLLHDGTVEGHFKVAARGGNDVILISSTGTVGGHVRLNLGHGTNDLTVDGAIEGSLRYRGGDDDDTILISDNALVGGNLYAKLGDGTDNGNGVIHNGIVAGDFSVASLNEDDVVDTDNGTIDGETNIAVGEQARGFYHFSPGRGRVFRTFARGWAGRGAGGTL